MTALPAAARFDNPAICPILRKGSNAEQGHQAMAAPKGNLFDAIPLSIEDELFTELIARDDCRLERIISRGQASPATGWYDQAEHEWVLIIEGEAEIVFDDGEVVPMKRGDYLTIPAHTRHRVQWTTPERETVWLALHYR
jgi:cupin 2 domain-containing protein